MFFPFHIRQPLFPEADPISFQPSTFEARPALEAERDPQFFLILVRAFSGRPAMRLIGEKEERKK